MLSVTVEDFETIELIQSQGDKSKPLKGKKTLPYLERTPWLTDNHIHMHLAACVT